MVLADLRVARRGARRRLPAPDPAPPARPPRRARMAGASPGPSSSSSSSARHLRGRLAARLPRPDSGEPLQRRLLAARDRPRRAAHPTDPQRDGRRRAHRRELEGRVQLRPTRDQLPLRRGPRHRGRRTRSTRTAPRRSPPRRAGRSPYMAKWDEREGNSCHIHLSLADAGTGESALRARTDRCSIASSPASSRRMRGADAHVRPAGQLLQTLRRRLVRADRPRMGERQPHVLAARRRARAGAARGEPAAGRRREPVPRAGRDDRRRAARDRRGASSSSPRTSATPTSRTSRACRTPSTRLATSSRGPRWRARRSARRWSTTT